MQFGAVSVGVCGDSRCGGVTAVCDAAAVTRGGRGA